MKTITSTQNETFKSLFRLTSKKGRDEQDSFLIEGAKLIRDAISSGMELRMVVYRDTGCDTDVAESLDLQGDCREVILDDNLFFRISDHASPVSVFAAASRPRFDTAALNGKSIVVLDRLQDPGNVGTVIRTAEAAGFAGLIAIRGTADVWSQKVCRAAAGAIARLPLFVAENGEAALTITKKLGLRPVVCDMSGESIYKKNSKVLAGNIALIIGNEGSGAADEMKTAAMDIVSIPMRAGSESLNAAVAAGIIMYEKKRQEECCIE